MVNCAEGKGRIMDATIKAKRVTAAAGLTLEERTKRIADTDEAIAKGAKQGPDAIWPDPSITMSHVQTADEEHWTRYALRHTPDELAELREAIAELPPEVAPRPPFVRPAWDTPKWR
jgi:hypothetical protein